MHAPHGGSFHRPASIGSIRQYVSGSNGVDSVVSRYLLTRRKRSAFAAFESKRFESPVPAAVLLLSSTEVHIQQQAIVGPELVGRGPAS